MQRIFLWVSILLLGPNVWGSETSATLSLESYLEQVRSRNQDYLGSKMSASANQRTSREGSLVVLPNLELTASKIHDEFRPSANPYPLQSKWASGMRVKERTPVGLDAKVGFEWDREELGGLASSPLAKSRYYAELSTDLTRNFLGASTRAEKNQSRDAALAAAEREAARVRQLEADAEAVYWEVVVSRLNYQFQSDALRRAQKLVSWNKSKSQLELVNESSLAQANANLSQREVAFQLATESLRRTSLAFNSLRQVSGSQVEPLVDLSSLETIRNLPPRERKSMERNLRAQKKALEFERAQAILGRSRNTPGLVLFGGLQSQAEGSRDRNNKSISDSSSFENVGYQVGVNFSTPLGFAQLFDAHKGYDQQIAALNLKIERLNFLDEQGWQDLQEQFRESLRELEARLALERNAEKRARADQGLFDRGRTTTFQVVQAEQDLADAQLSRLQAHVQVLRLYAQMNLYD